MEYYSKNLTSSAIEMKNLLSGILVDPNISDGGICHYINTFISKLSYGAADLSMVFKNTMKEACVDWEHYSGDYIYPVSHPYYSGDNGFHNTRMHEYFDGEYGRRRLELVQRMVDILENKLD